MSETRVTVGVIAELVWPVGDTNHQLHKNLEDRLYKADSKLQVSYDGTMIVYTHTCTPVYDAGLTLFGGNEDIFAAFVTELKEAGLATHKGRKKLFVETWHDGSDPQHLMVTLKEVNFDV